MPWKSVAYVVIGSRIQSQDKMGSIRLVQPKNCYMGHTVDYILNIP